MQVKFFIVAALLILAALPGGVEAQQRRELNLNDMAAGIETVAQQIHEVLRNEGAGNITLGKFQAQAQVSANFSAGLVAMLGEALERRQTGILKPDSPYSVAGRYAVIEEKNDPTRVFLKITIQIIARKSDDVLQEFVASVRNNNDIARAAGHSGPLPGEGSTQDRNKKMKEQIDKPAVFFDGSLIKTHKDSPYAVEILAKRLGSPGDAKPVQPSEVKGQAFVDLKEGDLYEIRIHNGDPRQTAVGITIDGLSVFTFSEVKDKIGKPSYTHYIIPENAQTTIVGWHIRNNPPANYHSFLVTEYGKGASQFVPSPERGEPGVICIAFSRTSPKGKGRGGSETGLGPPRDVNVKEVAVDIEPPMEFLTIRYNR